MTKTREYTYKNHSETKTKAKYNLLHYIYIYYITQIFTNTYIYKVEIA